MSGTVVWYNRKLGYGFIKGEDGTDYFAHHSRITSDQKRAFLKSGANVTFDLAENIGRQCADNITAV